MTGMLPATCGGRVVIPGSTVGGVSVPFCCVSLSLSVALSGGAIFSGTVDGEPGDPTGGCTTCGGAGCGFCAPAAHGSARPITKPSTRRCFIVRERRKPRHVPHSRGCEAQCCQVFQGASPDAHSASSVVLSRNVSIGCQKPRGGKHATRRRAPGFPAARSPTAYRRRRSDPAHPDAARRSRR